MRMMLSEYKTVGMITLGMFPRTVSIIVRFVTWGGMYTQ